MNAENETAARRRRMRLEGYDYRQAGAYFVTVCTQGRACVFGSVADGAMILNDAGVLVQEEWCSLPARFPHVCLDTYVVMPNHIHGIIVVDMGGRAPASGVPPLGEIVGAFKSVTTLKYVRGVKCAGWRPFDGRLWQRGYYEHIIRAEESLGKIGEYISNNPQQWLLDGENPQRVRL